MVTRTVITGRKVAVLDKNGNNLAMKELAGSGSVTRAEKRDIASELGVGLGAISCAVVENITSKYAISDAEFMAYACCIDGMSRDEIKEAIRE